MIDDGYAIGGWYVHGGASIGNGGGVGSGVSFLAIVLAAQRQNNAKGQCHCHCANDHHRYNQFVLSIPAPHRVPQLFLNWLLCEA